MMSEANVIPGDKLHIITRRLYIDDLRRHFAGEVISHIDGLCELRGYAFIFHAPTNQYQKRDSLRTRIFALGDANLIINKIPSEVDIDALHYRVIEGRLAFTDLAEFSLDINEFGAID